MFVYKIYKVCKVHNAFGEVLSNEE